MAMEIPPLSESTILLVEGGSTAHGTGLPGGEDHDEMGVVVEGAADVVGLGKRGFPTFDEWWDRALALDAQLERMESDPSLRAGPDWARIEALSVATHRYWSS